MFMAATWYNLLKNPKLSCQYHLLMCIQLNWSFRWPFHHYLENVKNEEFSVIIIIIIQSILKLVKNIQENECKNPLAETSTRKRGHHLCKFSMSISSTHSRGTAHLALCLGREKFVTHTHILTLVTATSDPRVVLFPLRQDHYTSPD